MSPEYIYYLNFLQLNEAFFRHQQYMPSQNTPLRLTWTGPALHESSVLPCQNKSFKNKKWTVQKDAHSLAKALLFSQKITSQAALKPSSSSTLFLNLNSLLETVCPKNTASESAFSFFHQGNEVLVDMKRLVLHLYRALKAHKMILSDFNLIGGALQNIILHKEKKVGGDIDFLGHVRQANGKKANSQEVLEVLLEVLDNLLFPSLSSQLMSKQARLKKFYQKPYVLKTLFSNENFVLVTIPLRLQDPQNPSEKIFVDIDIRMNLEKKIPSCIASAGCFEYDLLRLFRGEHSGQIPVTGSHGYENSVEEAFELLQQGAFFVNEKLAATTSNGLRAYATLLVKGLFPIDYISSKIYFLKWVKECEAGKEGVALEVNHFFYELEKFVLRHYSLNGKRDVFALSLYLMNLRTLFATQKWPHPWTYNKLKFLKIFDDKAFFLLKTWMPGVTAKYLTTIKFLLFWHCAAHSKEMTPIANSPHLFVLRDVSKRWGILTEIPWEETVTCNWEDVEQQMQAMSPYLESLGLPLSCQQLKEIILEALYNPSHPHISAAASENILSEEGQQAQKILKLGLQPEFDYALFFSIFLRALRQSPDLRQTTLRNVISFIRHQHPEHAFKNLENTSSEDVSALFGALSMDLKSSEEAQDALCKFLLRPCCKVFREQALPLIFPHLTPKRSEHYFDALWTDKERKELGISSTVFYQLLITALSSQKHLKAWDKTLRHKLPSLLEEASKGDLPLDILNAIGKFFCTHQNLNFKVLLRTCMHLQRLGYTPDFPTLNALFAIELPKNQEAEQLLTCLESLLVDKIFTTYLPEIWIELLPFTARYLHRFPINRHKQRDDKLFDAILFKISIHSFTEEAVEMFIALIQNQSTPSASLLSKYIQTFHNMMEADQSLYNSEKATILWGVLVLQMCGLTTQEERVHSVLSAGITKLVMHFTKFDISLPECPVSALSILTTSPGENSPLYMKNLSKIARQAQTNFSTSLVQNWANTLTHLLDTNMQVEECFEVYKFFMSPANSALMDKIKRKEYFLLLQKKVLASILLQVKGVNEKNVEHFFHCVRLLHKNFIEAYRWMGVNHLFFNQSIQKHVQMLDELRKYKALAEYVQETELFSLELLVWAKENVPFSQQEAMDFSASLGLISDLNMRDQIFEQIVQLASKTVKKNRTENQALPAPCREEEIIITNFVYGGLRQLMLSPGTQKDFNYYLHFFNKHSALRGSTGICIATSLLNALLDLKHVNPASEKYKKMVMYMEIISYVYSHPSNNDNQKLRQIVNFCNKQLGLSKFIDIHNRLLNTPETARAHTLLSQYQKMRDKYKLFE